MERVDRQSRREAAGRSDAALCRTLDAQAQQVTMKYERPSFAVIGESSRAAQDAYRYGYDAIDWSQP
jgi:hypothetical protein